MTNGSSQSKPEKSTAAEAEHAADNGASSPVEAAAARDDTTSSVEPPESGGTVPNAPEQNPVEAEKPDVETSAGLEESDDQTIAEHELPLNGLRGYTSRRRP